MDTLFASILKTLETINISLAKSEADQSLWNELEAKGEFYDLLLDQKCYDCYDSFFPPHPHLHCSIGIV